MEMPRGSGSAPGRHDGKESTIRTQPWLLTLGLALGLPLASNAQAQDCPHGTLDARFCDRDGDLVADLPNDPRQIVDPAVLIFAYSPLEAPSVCRRVFDGFLPHLSRVTGKRTQLFSVQSNAPQIEAMRAGRLHIAGFNTGATPLAVNCAGFVPFAVTASNAGEFGYEMEIIVRADSPIQRVEDLRGRERQHIRRRRRR
jgi:phosphonate transport system substrate-binding protein